MELSSGQRGPCSTGLGTNMYQCTADVAVRGYVLLRRLFLKILSMNLPMISWWMIYEPTCPHHAECSAVFDQKWHDPHAPSSLFTRSGPKWLLFSSASPGEKKSSKENILPCKRGKTKNGRSTKRQQNWVQNCFEQWEKHLDPCIATNVEYFKSDWSLIM